MPASLSEDNTDPQAPGAGGVKETRRHWAVIEAVIKCCCQVASDDLSKFEIVLL